MRFLDYKGKTVDSNDPSRLIWYSSLCDYWTDDWDKLIKVGPGIPACPNCHSVGFQDVAFSWFHGVEQFNRTNPGYSEFVKQHKEICSQKGFLVCWEEFKKNNV